jgi:DNA-binding HxlR family transcriptional regulator
MRWSELEDQACSLSRTLGVIGDRWTLMVLRDCFLRIRRFEDFQSRLGVSRAVLTERLDKLVENFILAKVPYQERPTRYEYRLTPKGLDMYPIIMSMVHWGDVHMAGKKGRPVLHRHQNCGHVFDPVLVCSECNEPVEPRAVDVMAGPGAGSPRHLPADVELPVRRAVAVKAGVAHPRPRSPRRSAPSGNSTA